MRSLFSFLGLYLVVACFLSMFRGCTVSASLPSPTVTISRSLWKKTMNTLVERRKQIESLRLKVSQLESELSTEKRACTALVLKERVICARKSCPVVKPDPKLAIALGICIPTAVGLGIGGFYIGRGSK